LFSTIPAIISAPCVDFIGESASEMADWDELTTPQKLGWLKDEIARLDGRIDKVDNSLTGAFNRALANLKKTVETLAADLGKLKGQ
jgi:hypothetical protein